MIQDTNYIRGINAQTKIRELQQTIRSCNLNIDLYKQMLNRSTTLNRCGIRRVEGMLNEAEQLKRITQTSIKDISVEIQIAFN